MTAVSPHWIRVTHPLLLGPTLNIDGPGRIDASLILDYFALELVWYRVILSNLVCKSIQAPPPPPAVGYAVGISLNNSAISA